MWHTPNPVLNAEEVLLLEERPEECLRRAIGRAALSLDEITHELPPHVAAAIRGIVTGERPPVSRFTPPRSEPGSDALRKLREWFRDKQDAAQALDQAHSWLADCYPHLDGLLGDGLLTPDEAVGAAHSVDAALGRYTTGTRYAAP